MAEQCGQFLSTAVDGGTRSGWLAELSADSQCPKSCDFNHMKTGGPGGQKRNKTSSAVRLVHRPTGLSVESSEHRSQRINLARALQRLQMRIALKVRCPPQRPLPGWWTDWVASGGVISRRSPMMPEIAALVLDVMEAEGYALGESAKAVGLSTARLAKLIRETPGMLNHVNSQRRKRLLRTLRG